MKNFILDDLSREEVFRNLSKEGFFFFRTAKNRQYLLIDRLNN
uniref:Uncharacterized protein n=1 Tax=Rhizophora mucronata TaxID=61149 RepID=A0A2P2P2L6_RHIMU